ncbi:hypothetical protein Taro_040513 [Colocasia esculenta]|uniref:Uncharacterized protein n=1 Tax=Colocasia esculenta TaxID=4460 RepID=A0A843WM42_COLES|nr:hypothetical protein [Colocasia esculenta]
MRTIIRANQLPASSPFTDGELLPFFLEELPNGMLLPMNFPALENPLPTAPIPLPTIPAPPTIPEPTNPAPAPIPEPTNPTPVPMPVPTSPTPEPTKDAAPPSASIVLPITPASFSFFLSSKILFSSSSAASCSSLGGPALLHATPRTQQEGEQDDQSGRGSSMGQDFWLTFSFT